MPGEALRATHVLEFPFTHSVGPLLSRFFTALRDDRQFLGARVALGHAFGGGAQYFSLALFGAAKP